MLRLHFPYFNILQDIHKMTARKIPISDTVSDVKHVFAPKSAPDPSGTALSYRSFRGLSLTHLFIHRGLRLCALILVTVLTVIFFTFSERSCTSVCCEASSFAGFDTSHTHLRLKHRKPRYVQYSDGIWRRPALKFSIISPVMYKENIKQFIRTRFASPLLFPDYSECVTRLALVKYLSSEEIITGCVTAYTDPSHKSSQTLLRCNDPARAVCMFTGDIMCLRGQQYDAETKDGFNFWPAYSIVGRIFKTADLVCGNLETLVSSSNPTTMEQKLQENGQPQCNGPVEILYALKKAGFDAFVTANNHTCDWGPVGITETKQELDRIGFANVGTHTDTDSGRFCIFDVNGIKIALLAYTQYMNQRTSMMEPDELTRMVHMHKMADIERDILDAREAGAEFVVVYCHWGTENTEELTKQQLDAPVDIAEAGADLILGSHPHCLQSCRYIETGDGRTVLCMHSLGNFCSSMERVDANKDTIILRIELEKTGTGVSVASASYIPCRMMPYGKSSFTVVPTDQSLNGGYTSSVLSDTRERIQKILGDTLPEYTPN